MFTKHIYNEEFASRIYKEFLVHEVVIGRQLSQLKNVQVILTLTKEDIWVANKHMKRSSTLLIMRKM